MGIVQRMSGKNQHVHEKIVNIPNSITGARLIGFVASAIAHMLSGPSLGVATGIALSCASDGLDGFLARRLGQKTEFGAKLDPMVDAAGFIISLAVLCISAETPAEKALYYGFLCTQISYSSHMYKLGTEIQDKFQGDQWVYTTPLGKIKTATVMSSLILLMGGPNIFSEISSLAPGGLQGFLGQLPQKDINHSLELLAKSGLIAGITMTIICWGDYWKKARELLDRKPDEK